MRRGVRIGLDIGTVRIGVAYCDADAIMAMPIKTISVDANAVNQVLEIVAEYQASVIYVGNPINMAGVATESTQAAHNFARKLREQTSSDVMIRMVDERLSTVSAQRGLQAAGKTQKASRSVIDQAAAVIILEQALEIEKRSNDLAGIEIGIENG